jgi:hypothetical protein
VLVPVGVVAGRGRLASFRGALVLRVVGAGNLGTVGTDRRELRVRGGGGGDVLVGGGATLVLFDARPEVPSVFLFPVGGGSRGGGFEEGATDDVEAGIMGTLSMAMSLPPTAVGSGIAGEPVAGLAGLEM